MLVALVVTVSPGHGKETLANTLAKDRVLLNASRMPIRIGRYSPFAEFKARLSRRLDDCSKSASIDSARDKPLEIALPTKRRIAALVACANDLDLPAGSPAQSGAITVALWRALLPGVALPTLTDRVDSLTLSFEATDFSDPPIWNFCQDTPAKPDQRPGAILAGAPCHNATDPCSMLTWGPRGATAGQGAEIQWILWKLYNEDRDQLVRAFGPEYANVTRYLALKRPSPVSCDGTSPVEHFMCAAWLSPERRQRWSAGLLKLGGSKLVRNIYRTLYAGLEFDGYKMVEYFQLWRSIGLTPSEVDYAYFFDRATHIGAPPAPGSPARAQFEMCISRDFPIGGIPQMRRPKARRCLALSHPHATQPVDRLGRDVSYYRAAYPVGTLSALEERRWQYHIPLDAALQFGLSDQRLIDAEEMKIKQLPPEDHPPQTSEDLTETELACPLRVRRPIRRPPPASEAAKPSSPQK